MLHVASGLDLPLGTVTQTFAVLAKRGAGKTYTGSVMAEEMLAAGQPIIVIDPTGAWWGLRASADGKRPAYPIVVFGGEHADVPLEDTAGEVIASSIVDNRFPAILDLSLLRKGQVRRFLTPFLETLYRLNREPVHLFVDEADDVCPQRPFGDEAAMLGAMEDVVKRGRKKGIGCTLITQRPADLAKQVLTQCEVLVCLRLVHPRDIAAIKEWVNVHADPETAREMIASLPALPIGTAWFWSPGWMDLFGQFAVRKRQTFDSGATPRAGEVRAEPRKLAEVDVHALGEKIAATIKRVKENDPRELKRLIADLERQLRDRPADVQRVEVPVLKNGQLEQLQSAVGTLRQSGEGIVAVAQELRSAMERASATPTLAIQSRPVTQTRPVAPPVGRAVSATATTAKLAKGERGILTALAQYPGGRTKTQVAILTGYAVGGGGFANYISSLRSRGLIEGAGDNLRITPAGLVALGSFTLLPTGRALFDHWIGQLGKAEREILTVLFENHPLAFTKEALAQRTPSNYAPDGGGFNNALSRLRTLELIQGRGEISASNVFWE